MGCFFIYAQWYDTRTETSEFGTPIPLYGD